jgi:hypothetical protein
VRKALALPQLGCGTVFGVHNHSLANVLRGLVERVFLVEKHGQLVSPPKPSAGVFDKLSCFRERLLRVLGSCRPWSVEQFTGSYRGAKQVLYERVAADVAKHPIHRGDAELRTFVKAEKLNLTSKPNPAPRVIQPRNPRYNVGVGPYIKAHEHNVYRAIADVWGGPTVMKGYNGRQVAKEMRKMWDSIPSPCAIGLDASRFDQHVSVPALEWEHSVYNGMFRCPRLRTLLAWQLSNKGLAYTPEGRVKYKVAGCRMSGDMNTALGNCLLMCAMVWELCRSLGITARLANNGDDCTLIVPKQHEKVVRNAIPGWFREFGFTMKVEDTVYEFEQIEFCQMHPVRTAYGWTMSRNPLTCLDKDTLCLHPASNPYHVWAAGIGTAGLALSSGVPVLQAFYTRLKTLAGQEGVLADGSGMAYLARDLPSELCPITDAARVSFYKAFGVMPWVQRLLEDELMKEQCCLAVGLNTASHSVHNRRLTLSNQYS